MKALIGVALLGLLIGCNPPAPPQPSPTPTPFPTPTPTPTPTPSPTPTPGVTHCGENLELIEPGIDPSVRAPLMQPILEAAKARVGDVCGKDPIDSLNKLAQELRNEGWCAGHPPADDEVYVKAPPPPAGDSLYEEWHAVYFGDGCWTSGTGPYKGAWRFRSE